MKVFGNYIDPAKRKKFYGRSLLTYFQVGKDFLCTKNLILNFIPGYKIHAAFKAVIDDEINPGKRLTAIQNGFWEAYKEKLLPYIMKSAFCIELWYMYQSYLTFGNF